MSIEEKLTVSILDKYNLFWDDTVSLGRNRCSIGNLVCSILTNRSIEKTSSKLGVTVRTLERYLPIVLSHTFKIENKIRSVPWRNTLLSLISIRQCYKCQEYRVLEDYHSNGTSNSTPSCKYCKSLDNSTVDSKRRRREYYRKYYESNRGSLIAKSKYDKLQRLMRVPSWAQLDKIKEFYNNCPKGMHVDHIVPLRGKLVSGLHVIENLQYLTPEDNWKKNNRFNGGED